MRLRSEIAGLVVDLRRVWPDVRFALWFFPLLWICRRISAVVRAVRAWRARRWPVVTEGERALLSEADALALDAHRRLRPRQGSGEDLPAIRRLRRATLRRVATGRAKFF